jgi:hypothetical protein
MIVIEESGSTALVVPDKRGVAGATESESNFNCRTLNSKRIHGNIMN